MIYIENYASSVGLCQSRTFSICNCRMLGKTSKINLSYSTRRKWVLGKRNFFQGSTKTGSSWECQINVTVMVSKLESVALIRDGSPWGRKWRLSGVPRKSEQPLSLSSFTLKEAGLVEKTEDGQTQRLFLICFHCRRLCFLRMVRVQRSHGV